MKKNPIEEAIEIVGGQTALAKKIGVKQPTVFKWLKKGVIPPRKVLIVEKITGISRFKLNPDIYPD
ncbi:hypothetical protein AQUSIP_13300 [Aquicella siphonis]|uniref:HTH cro/C1-type domain-containing protein n=1 Tax=Aquicella siphonis TaxID=254247 RepID=A0A5E4PGE5_9COXI|nr:Cro/CI family transcriptional regulator [Aquicella siphonis]VVC76029.1 hypothetical protein AQUSIP_13300 [Aquicella siphonis]